MADDRSPVLSAPVDIDIEAEPRRALTVSLVGVRYQATVPKGSLALVLAKRAKAAGNDPDKLMQEVQGWLRMAFGAKQAARIALRLEDADDDLDVIHVVTLIEKMAEAAAPNPTT